MYMGCFNPTYVSKIWLFLAFVAHYISMIEGTTLSSELMGASKVECLRDTNLNEVTVDSNEVSEEVFFRLIRDIQGLDIIVSLQAFGCFTLPYISMLLTTIAERQTIFKELSCERKYKKSFGFYAYKILKICVWKYNHSL